MASQKQHVALGKIEAAELSIRAKRKLGQLIIAARARRARWRRERGGSLSASSMVAAILAG
jgi:hypothetical protein